MLIAYQALITLAQAEFDDVVTNTTFIGGTPTSPNKIRFYIIDTSFLDVWLSADGDYSYHWERRGQTGEIYRWDNAPHHSQVSTFPDHFHKGDEQMVVESTLNPIPQTALREVLSFIRDRVS